MSADLNTTITIKGTPEELLAMLKVLKVFSTEKYVQYREKRDCGYINFVRVNSKASVCCVDNVSDEELLDFASNAGGKLVVDAGGPWGVFNQPGDVGLFEALADAAPGAQFEGHITGFITGADVAHSGELIDGKLYLSDYMIADEELPNLYVDEVEKKLPYSKFCKLFNVDKDEFEYDDYGCFLEEAAEEGFPFEMDYETFVDFYEGFNPSEEQYAAALEEIASLGIVEFDTFRESVNVDEYTEWSVYDPSTKKYSKLDKK